MKIIGPNVGPRHPTHHPQVFREVDGEEVWVDEGIAEVLDRLWAAGLRTFSSCQGGPPTGQRGWISFDTPEEAKRGAEILGWTDPPESVIHPPTGRMRGRLPLP